MCTEGKIDKGGRDFTPDHRRLTYEEGVTIEEIETAFVLTMARRRFRDPALPPLDPIRSLHYFVPVLGEVRAKSVPVDYVSYLRHKLARIRDGI
ncbi:MAG: hypothetical protein ACK5TZ_01485 [bacterium]